MLFPGSQLPGDGALVWKSAGEAAQWGRVWKAPGLGVLWKREMCQSGCWQETSPLSRVRAKVVGWPGTQRSGDLTPAEAELEPPRELPAHTILGKKHPDFSVLPSNLLPVPPVSHPPAGRHSDAIYGGGRLAA